VTKEDLLARCGAVTRTHMCGHITGTYPHRTAERISAMNPATETFFFSTTINGNGVLDKVFHPNQVDGRMPVINELSNVLLSAAEVTGDRVPFQGDASVEILNVSCSGDPAGSGSVHVRSTL
jgi:hypothetical protein